MTKLVSIKLKVSEDEFDKIVNDIREAIEDYQTDKSDESIRILVLGICLAAGQLLDSQTVN